MRFLGSITMAATDTLEVGSEISWLSKNQRPLLAGSGHSKEVVIC